MCKLKNFNHHYTAAIYKTALAVLRHENYKDMAYQASKSFLLRLAEDKSPVMVTA